VSSVILLGAAALVSSLLVLWWAVSGSEASSATVTRNLTTGVGPVDVRGIQLTRSARQRATEPALDHVVRLARRLTPSGVVSKLEERLLLAGTPVQWSIERVLAAKVVVGAVFGLLALLLVGVSIGGLFIVAVASVAGYLLPDLLIYNATTKRRLAIQRELPDVLDQLTICVEAGLALEGAMMRTSATSTDPLHVELARTMQDIRAGLGRRDALKALSARTRVEDLDRVVSAIIQAEGYGLPIAKVLRLQSGEMRLKRRQRAEEAAMKLPVKILFPTVLFIFPSIFVVLLGPAAIRIAESM
jgi:tight adherence protein C